MVKNDSAKNENHQLKTRIEMLDEILTRNDLRQEIEDYAFLIEMIEYDMHQHRNNKRKNS